MRIAIASGKGGTGKTTVAVSLAQSLSRDGILNVMLSDCDVEAPNVHLYLHPDFNEDKTVNQFIPKVNENRCEGSGTCRDVCQFNAIIMLKDKPVLFPELCHGCGSCTLTCPEEAIQEIPKLIGYLQRGYGIDKIFLRHGLLEIGEPQAVPVISALHKCKPILSPDLEIIDAPPGASCPVVEAIRNSDFVLLVTEPTPFGLHDLKQAHLVTRELEIAAGVIVNRDGFGNKDVQSYCHENQLPVMLQIPLDQNIGRGIAEGKTLLDIYPEYQDKFMDLYGEIKSLTGEKIDL